MAFRRRRPGRGVVGRRRCRQSGRRRWRTAAEGCENGRRDSCAPRRLVRARLLPQTPERAGDPRWVPPCEEAPLRPTAAAAGGGRSWLGRVRNWQRSLQTPPCAGSGVRSTLSVRHGRGVRLSARGTSDGAVWSCVQRQPQGQLQGGYHGESLQWSLSSGMGSSRGHFSKASARRLASASAAANLRDRRPARRHRRRAGPRSAVGERARRGGARPEHVVREYLPTYTSPSEPCRSSLQAC